ncbi:hypothetical protein C8A05DRAFT_31768 [Staphylotrichum tortipilum]|uniref:Uncharacterized protein n=1 Tax=Staphylotrichum tortipilum TaxID=2831512 RepID=A0AAN6MP08_9PEZI|nr:hypothetical protein C8A05DRAFT_31768 [Staphylotrichum longicolle]
MSGSVSTASKEPPEPSAPDKTLNVLNWPVQKRKMWHGKGRLPSWVEIRKVAEDAIDDELQSHSLERLIDTIRGPCRDAGFKAGRNRRDKHAQLKRDYYNMVMGLLRANIAWADFGKPGTTKPPPSRCPWRSIANVWVTCGSVGRFTDNSD